jgi:hypothetical protein
LNSRYGYNIQSSDTDPSIIPFHITQDDIFVHESQKTDTKIHFEGQTGPNGEIYDYEDHEQMLVNRILERAVHQG